MTLVNLSTVEFLVKQETAIVVETIAGLEALFSLSRLIHDITTLGDQDSWPLYTYVTTT